MVKEDMAEVEVTEEDGKSAVSTPDGKNPKEEESYGRWQHCMQLQFVRYDSFHSCALHNLFRFLKVTVHRWPR